MLFRLVRPMRRSDSQNRQFAKRIPADIRGLLIGRRLTIPFGRRIARVLIGPKTSSIRFSLQTADPLETKQRIAEAAAYLETVFEALRQAAPVAFTHRQAVAFSKRMYEAWSTPEKSRTISVEIASAFTQASLGLAAEHIVGPVTYGPVPDVEGEGLSQWAEKIAASREAQDEAALERQFGPLINRELLEEGIGEVDAASRRLVLFEFARAIEDALANQKRNLLEGDYTPDPKANRFPPFDRHPVAPRIVSSMQLVEDWWTEAKATGLAVSTYQSYASTMANFVAFLKHDDAANVTPEDIIAFKDHRLASVNPRTGQPISSKTIKDSDLAGLKAVFRWAVNNRRLPSNPAQGVTIKLAKPKRLRSKGYSNSEAAEILGAASKIDKNGKHSRTDLALRWVPWLMAYSGARVGELAQLRTQDLRREGGHWIIKITPEAGTVKTKEARDVVLHAHLVEVGFPEFVLSQPEGHLFVRAGANADVRGSLKGVTNRLAAFARGIVSDVGVAPNHGWRHRFRTVGRAAGIENSILNAIDGHAAETVGDQYGETTIEAQALAMAKFPRIVPTG